VASLAACDPEGCDRALTFGFRRPADESLPWDRLPACHPSKKMTGWKPIPRVRQVLPIALMAIESVERELMNRCTAVRCRLNATLVSLSALFAVCLSRPVCGDENAEYQTQILPILRTHCYECHGDGAAEGSFALDQFSSETLAQSKPDVWWNVLKNVRSGVMPPAEKARPTPEDAAALARWIKFRVFQIDPENPDPGKLPVRRLNRTEYGNTVSDLMGIRFDAASLFPPDDSGFGFDNVGDALSFSPLLMEQYLRAAQSIVDRSVPKVTSNSRLRWAFRATSLSIWT